MWLIIDGFRSHREAVRFASRIILFLINNGWSEMGFAQYIDGHVFKKREEN
jgi:hypothetical protein